MSYDVFLGWNPAMSSVQDSTLSFEEWSEMLWWVSHSEYVVVDRVADL